jgi:hypothetical protein
MEPEKDIFEQWSEERSKKSWIVRKIEWISLWWNTMKVNIFIETLK